MLVFFVIILFVLPRLLCAKPLGSPCGQTRVADAAQDVKERERMEQERIDARCLVSTLLLFEECMSCIHSCLLLLEDLRGVHDLLQLYLSLSVDLSGYTFTAFVSSLSLFVEA